MAADYKNSPGTIKLLVWALAFIWGQFTNAHAQCPTNKEVKVQLLDIENDTSLSTLQKRNVLIDLAKRYDECKIPRDSVYARIFNRLGFYEFKLNNNIANNAVFNYTLTAVHVNKAAGNGSSLSYSINCYKNLAYYYKSIQLYNEALAYFDSTISVAGNIQDQQREILLLRLAKNGIFFEKKDYQKIIDESTTGLLASQKLSDLSLVTRFLSQRAQCYYFLGDYKNALSDADKSLELAMDLTDNFEVSNTTKIKALVAAAKGDYPAARALFKKVISSRIKTNDHAQLADDYTDYGNFYLNNLADYSSAVKNYQQAIFFAEKENDAERQAKAHLNLGAVSFYRKNYLQALEFNHKALNYFNISGNNSDYVANPSSTSLKVIGNKELLLFIFNNKTEILLNLFMQTRNKAYLSASLQTALLMDTLITKVRHEQAGELSKLYWRDKTREFFTTAMEACFQANDTRLAFFIMEKSRSVLLNDKLNEIGAAQYLPAAEIAREQSLKIELVTAKQNLALVTNENQRHSDARQSDVLKAQEKLELYVKSLEKKYPVYYQYKYADKIVSINELQQYLGTHQQSFIHYFMNDTVLYVLGITPGSSKILKYGKDNFSSELVTTFNGMCKNKKSLLEKYDQFAKVSNKLYEILFQPLEIIGGRVIICPDNFILPFEALCTDKEGKNFLLSSHVFSYVYSARYLLNHSKPTAARHNFVGYAPVSFLSYLKLPDLKQSEVSLKTSADNYRSKDLFIGEQATKSNFLHNIGSSGIVNIFSHAVADSTVTEPLLYMQDSVIQLSELQAMGSTVASLVVLSACQTNVGKNATGEGVYSFARAFAAIGIPSVAATLWNADEQSIYTISELFHKYLSQGTCKDSALQKAKLDFILKNKSNERSLPYFWANMIIIGDVEPVALSSGLPMGWIVGSVVTVILLVSVFVVRKKN